MSIARINKRNNLYKLKTSLRFSRTRAINKSVITFLAKIFRVTRLLYETFLFPITYNIYTADRTTCKPNS